MIGEMKLWLSEKNWTRLVALSACEATDWLKAIPLAFKLSLNIISFFMTVKLGIGALSFSLLVQKHFRQKKSAPHVL